LLRLIWFPEFMRFNILAAMPSLDAWLMLRHRSGLQGTP
jgi:hypothetical protein